MSNFEQVELLSKLTGTPQSLEGDAGIKKRLTVLKRPVLSSVRMRVKDIIDIPEHLNRYSKRVLVGPAGVGKSLLLYLCARDCILNGNWLVLYIASTTRFDRDVNAAAEIVRMILETNESLFVNNSKPTVIQIKNKADEVLKNPSRAPDILNEIIFLMRHCEVPVFIGIDQWNCLQKQGGIEQTQLKDLFGHFSKFNGKWGFTLLALSSSFDLSSSGMFADMDAELSKERIDLYNKTEWFQLVEYYRTQGILPPVHELNEDSLWKLSGNVPRLLMVVKQEYLGLRSKGFTSWSLGNSLNVRSSNLKYLVDRVQRVIDRHSEKDNLVFAAAVVINRYSRSISDSSPWIDSGLFYLENGIAVPIASDVLDAMYTVVSSASDRILDVIAKSEAKGIAFQMFVQLGFSKRQSMFEFSIQRLNGEVNIGFFRLIVANHVLQEKDVLEPHIEDNTMIICYKDHPVVDLVIYSMGKIYLVSISTSSYSEHTTTAKDVFTCTVGNSGKSILQYYCELSPFSLEEGICTSKSWTQPLQNVVSFIYITTDQTKHSKQTMKEDGAKHVYRINGKQLGLFGYSYSIF